jgi:2,4-dienoyl-CoA reductase-like NADH-dependent reductase (Old Yellow Enzyme family)
MNRTVLAGAGAALVVAGVVGLGVAQARTDGAAAETTGVSGAPAWLHVRVDEHGKSSKVRVNVPLTVVEAALEAAPARIVDKGRIKIDLGHDRHDGHEGHDLSLAEMRKIWQSLKDAGDTEIVSVEDEDETVNVARKGDLVQVRVTKPSGKQEVQVDVPVSLVDAVLAGSGDSVDVKAVIRELRARRGDIVRVNDEDSAVRIWIDESAAGEAR